ncbi:MAG TPA: DinB family protein [Galbitalea sp.]|jgi:uncharacterized damage-inducible protein DinB|nr:DinB family protein [Galbitalea sp.]
MKKDLTDYLQEGRDAVLWKLEGLSEYDARRPMVRTGTNLLGLVKHLAWVEAGYFGGVFDKPFPDDSPWDAQNAEPNADMWATPDESRDDMIGLYRRVWAHSDRTIESLDLDAPGLVPWWSEASRNVTLHRILVHVTAETHRHAGHADIVRELVDGSIGYRPGGSNLPDPLDWDTYRAGLEEAAHQAQEAQSGGD